ncbi:PIG-L family deacetylase [Jiella pelagia]|uniref:PIG-L family deacetylase n=1 Tax=Jiella pelagia TaxID=2986949 RepID=A0ABY7BU12_9HYPH|nr:PIG-L family deacetylase [Jiella pelagia]WAP66743.1 PIG-L family deacetylase [Jiella pelagia]
MSETYADWIGRCAAAPDTEARRLVGTGGLVVLSPHPDDETFGASALLQEAGRTGRAVGIVAVTDGEASHPGSRSVSRQMLAGIRRAEHEAAVKALGVGEARFLRLQLPDGGSGRDPRFREAAQRVAQFCDAIGASTLSAPHPDDPHPDHHATAALAEAVREPPPALAAPVLLRVDDATCRRNALSRGRSPAVSSSGRRGGQGPRHGLPCFAARPCRR